MEMPKKEIKKWINALRSGKYQQHKYSLQSESGFCCLGVACKELIPKDRLVLNKSERIAGFTVELQKDAPIWLKELEMDFQQKTGKFITNLNDSFCEEPEAEIVDTVFTFDEIADLLQAVYIEEVLK